MQKNTMEKDLNMIHECCKGCFGSIENLKKISMLEQLRLVKEMAEALNHEELDFIYKGDVYGKCAESNFYDAYEKYTRQFWEDEELRIGSRTLNVLMALEKQIGEEKLSFKYNKIKACIKKYMMTHYAGKCLIDAVREHEYMENMEFPTLFGEDEIEILYHVESMILQARSALDTIAPVFSEIILNKRIDSFNSLFDKILDKGRDNKINEYIEREYNDDSSIFRLLCGMQKGRALRDIIAHQTIARLEYATDKTSYKDRERLYIVVNEEYYSIEYFVLFVTIGVSALLSRMEQYLELFLETS